MSESKPTTLRQAIELAHGQVAGPAGAAFLNWAKARQVHPDVVGVLAECWIISGARGLGSMDVHSDVEIVDTNTKEPRYLDRGFLVIGSCCNGDMVAVDLHDRPGAVGYLSHDALWEDESLDPRDHFAVSAPSIEAFAIGSWGDDFPDDYYEARRLRSGDS